MTQTMKVLDRPINLGIVLQSHLNDMPYDSAEFIHKRIKFIKALTFFNEDLRRDVSDAYVDWLWKEVLEGNWGSSFEDYQFYWKYFPK